MKVWLALVSVVIGSLNACGQGSVDFICVIKGQVLFSGGMAPVQGFGNLTLDGSLLNYDLRVPNLRELPAEAHFHADGTLTQISLVHYVNVPPGNGWPGGIAYDGSLALQPQQRADLLAGHWYIQLHSVNYFNGVLRGYIVPVPEPSPLLLAETAALGLACRSGIKRWRQARNRT